MPVNVLASRSVPDAALSETDAAGHPESAPRGAWDRVERRRPAGAPLTGAFEFTATPGGGTSPECLRSSAIRGGGAPAERRLGVNDRRWSKHPGRRGQADASHAVDKTWKVRDVAEFLQASESWVRHAAASGRLPCTKIGGLLRFDSDEIRSLARPAAPAHVVARR